MIVMLPFPSVWIFVRATTAFPENAGEDTNCDVVSLCRSVSLDCGIRMRWLMSFSVTSPCTPHGLRRVKGYATGVTSLVAEWQRVFLAVETVFGIGSCWISRSDSEGCNEQNSDMSI